MGCSGTGAAEPRAFLLLLGVSPNHVPSHFRCLTPRTRTRCLDFLRCSLRNFRQPHLARSSSGSPESCCCFTSAVSASAESASVVEPLRRPCWPWRIRSPAYRSHHLIRPVIKKDVLWLSHMLKFLLITKGLCIIYIFSLVNMFFLPTMLF